MSAAAYDSRDIEIEQLRAELERVQKQCAAMREMILPYSQSVEKWFGTFPSCKCSKCGGLARVFTKREESAWNGDTVICPSCGNLGLLSIEKGSPVEILWNTDLSADAGSDFIRRDDVKPLVEALVSIFVLYGPNRGAGEISATALARAKTLGFE